MDSESPRFPPGAFPPALPESGRPEEARERQKAWDAWDPPREPQDFMKIDYLRGFKP